MFTYHDNRNLRRVRRAGLSIAVAAFAVVSAVAQDDSQTGRAVPVVRQATASDSLPALHAIRPVPPHIDGVRELPRKLLPNRVGSEDPAGVTETLVQENALVGVSAAVGVGFDGVANVNGVLPPDPTGAAGPNHYVQAVNLSMAIYNRSGTLLWGPANTNTIWSGFSGPCQSSNDGDPIVLYDRQADRFLVSQFALPNYPSGPFYQCIAVSQTADPMGAWHRYAFLVSNTKMNDYPKLSVWPDGYYMSVNQFAQVNLSWSGAGVAVFERSKMLTGNPAARIIYFDLYSVNANLGGMLPSDWDGSAAPPAGAGNVFAEIDDGSWGYTGGQDQIWLWKFQTDWVNPNSSSFTSLRTLATSPFDTNLCGYSRSCIPQPGTTRKLDALSDRLMFRLAYRNFSGDQRIVLNHTVDVNGSDRAGIRWYELQDTGSGWGIRQQGTYAPADTNHRWMGSIAMNDNGDIALAYSVSGAVSPSLRFTGRMAGDSLGQMTQPETSIVSGSGYQTHSASRWGDYSHLSADPVDPTGFWYTGEYTNSVSSASWRTRIASLSLSGAPPPPTLRSHIGDLDQATTTSRNSWQARVTVTVHDESHAPVSNATVSASWTGGYSGGGSCVTGGSGTCTISSGNINNKKTSATLTVTSVSHAAYTYTAASNHDPDADSNGTAITVLRP